MNISKKYISSVSINDAAVKNGADLVKKKNFSNLAIDKDSTFIAGECQGSGKNPYFCSVDFIDESSPVFRCTCPSRQIPCKHVIGLMWAYAEGDRFAEAEIPADIIEKRENKEKRAARAKEKAEKAAQGGLDGEAGVAGQVGSGEPKEKSAAWKKSAVKKIEAQLTGIEEAEKILTGIAGLGLGSLDAKAIKNYEDVVKQLDSYYIPGIQKEINELLGMVRFGTGAGLRSGAGAGPGSGSGAAGGGHDAHMLVTEKLCRIFTVLAKGKEYLKGKKEAPDKMDTESEIEELLGYAWKLDELAGYGLFETDARLVQLCFHVRQEDDKKQYVEEGFFASLWSGRIYKTRSYRPYKAAKYIKEEDSVFGVLNIPKLFIYPSLSLNPRVRWEEGADLVYTEVSAEDCRQLKSFAHNNYAELAKAVKNQLKNIYLFPHPAALVSFSRIARISGEAGDDGESGSAGSDAAGGGKAGYGGSGGKKYAVFDSSGGAICLKRSAYCQADFMFLLDRLTKAETEDGAMLLLFDNDIETGELFAQPLALVTDSRIVRLLF